MNEEKQPNNSNQTALPEGVRGWSWGAFLLTWIWGINNKTYRALWCFVPIVSICMRIALGIKGREWAWKHKQWESVEQFNHVQKRWAIAGFIATLVTILLLALKLYLTAHPIFSNGQIIQPTKITPNGQVQNGPYAHYCQIDSDGSGTIMYLNPKDNSVQAVSLDANGQVFVDQQDGNIKCFPGGHYQLSGYVMKNKTLLGFNGTFSKDWQIFTTFPFKDDDGSRMGSVTFYACDIPKSQDVCAR